MRAEDRAAFVELLGSAMAFYRQEVSEFALSVWWQACDCFALEQVRKALTAHAMDPERGHFPPKPSDIVRVLAGTQTDRALVAWGVVHRAMQTEGAYRSVVFAEPEIHAAIDDMGGWQKLCRSGIEELPFLQRRFCDTYRAYLSRGCPTWPPVLLGEHDATNALVGRKPRAPVLIGNANGCEAVMGGPGEVARLATGAVRAIA